MKKILIVAGLLMAVNAFGQNHNLISQYFQVMPFHAPGLTGANDYLDIRTGFRKQWVNFEGAPLSYFIGGSGAINIRNQNMNKYNSVKVNNELPYNKSFAKIGVGGYIFDEKIGEFNEFGALVSTAVHISITGNLKLSLGITSGFNNARLDVERLTVLRPDNDDIYQDYLRNGSDGNYFKLNSGLAAYSDQFYLSYALLNLVNVRTGGNLNVQENASGILHTIVGGYRFSLGPKYEIVPNAYFRISSGLPSLFDIGARVRYQQLLYVGMSYRNDKSIIGLLGFTLSDKFSFGYSFERKNINFGALDPISHEVVIGIKLFNNNKYSSLW